MAWIWFITYCLPVSPMVTTRMSDIVPITMPSAVRAKRTLLVRNESMAMLSISLKSIVLVAVSVRERRVMCFYFIPSGARDRYYRTKHFRIVTVYQEFV